MPYTMTEDDIKDRDARRLIEALNAVPPARRAGGHFVMHPATYERLTGQRRTHSGQVDGVRCLGYRVHLDGTVSPPRFEPATPDPPGLDTETGFDYLAHPADVAIVRSDDGTVTGYLIRTRP